MEVLEVRESTGGTGGTGAAGSNGRPYSKLQHQPGGESRVSEPWRPASYLPPSLSCLSLARSFLCSHGRGPDRTGPDGGGCEQRERRRGQKREAALPSGSPTSQCARCLAQVCVPFVYAGQLSLELYILQVRTPVCQLWARC